MKIVLNLTIILSKLHFLPIENKIDKKICQNTEAKVKAMDDEEKNSFKSDSHNYFSF